MAPVPVTVRSTRNCPNTPRALMALEELAVPYDTAVEEDGWFRERVGVPGPQLEDGGLVVIEINAILRHLARTYGGGALLPADSAGLAAMDRWMEMYRRIGDTLFPEPRPEKGARLVGFVERWLDGRDWLCGAFSIADCSYLGLAIAPSFERLPLGAAPRFDAYLERVRARPSAARALARVPR